MKFLLVLVPSGHPQQFFITKTSRTLNLSWSPPIFSQRNGVITSYIISCLGKDSRYNANATENNLSFTKVMPFTNYTCSVRATTVKGEGPAAVESVVTNEDGICYSVHKNY